MDKNYWKNVFRARKEIYDMLIEHDVKSIRSKDPIHPYLNQIYDNGGIGLELFYGVPSKLYTPLGTIDITCNFVYCKDENPISERLVSDYGVVFVDQIKRDDMGIRIDPIYAITRLPWSEQKLPVFKYRKRKDYIDYDEANNLYKKATEN